MYMGNQGRAAVDHDIPASSQEDGMPAFAEKMRQAGLPEAAVELYSTSYDRLFKAGRGWMLPEICIDPIQPGEIVSRQELSSKAVNAGWDLLTQAVAIKLNGGLGTSMGGRRSKSMLKVKDGLTFLDVILSQAAAQHLGEMPLVLMNSPRSHEEVLDVLGERRLSEEHKPMCFKQHMLPKVLAESLQPASWPDRPDLEWNPAGHGDLLASLATSGILDRLLNLGKRYAFVSNADNLAPTVDPVILGYMAANKLTFLLEVAERSDSDRSLGHLARLPDGHLTLREPSQCPEGDVEAFQDTQRHHYVNTNNIWIDLLALKSFIQKRGLPRLPLLSSPGRMDPDDQSSPEVLQLKTSLGSAISILPRSGALVVGRDRFVPVKTTSDLLAIRSSCFFLGPCFELRQNARRTLPPLFISLDDRYFSNEDDFEARFPFGLPQLFGCASLEVVGDFLFSPRVICRGDVRLENRTSRQIRIPPGAILEGEAVWGDEH